VGQPTPPQWDSCELRNDDDVDVDVAMQSACSCTVRTNARALALLLAAAMHGGVASCGRLAACYKSSYSTWIR
jgi:hypothetical protein